MPWIRGLEAGEAESLHFEFLAGPGQGIVPVALDLHVVFFALPPPASVRVEEWVNAFHYEYAGPSDALPFAHAVRFFTTNRASPSGAV